MAPESINKDVCALRTLEVVHAARAGLISAVWRILATGRISLKVPI